MSELLIFHILNNSPDRDESVRVEDRLHQDEEDGLLFSQLNRVDTEDLDNQRMRILDEVVEVVPDQNISALYWKYLHCVQAFA